MKKNIVLFILFILFSGPALLEHRACAAPSGDISIIKEDGLYKLISRDIPFPSDDRFSIPYSTSGGAINPHLHAALQKLTPSGPVFKTYYAPGEEVALWAMWGPPFIWGSRGVGPS